MSTSPKRPASALLPLFLMASALVLGSSLTACDLYIDGEGPGYIVEPPQPDASPDIWPDGEEGWYCETNASCAAGCYCDVSGFCEEAGFCETSDDCFDGFVCDDRSSCVPDVEPEPEPTCADLDANESACIAAEACSPVYRGVNCSSDSGEECTAGAASCSCESFLLDRCEELESSDDAG